MTIIEQAETLAAKVLATPATDQDIDTVNTVSYTHLTLPTIA